MDGETPPLPVTGEWMVGYHRERWPLPAFSRPFRVAHLPVEIESSRPVFCPTQMKGAFGEIATPYRPQRGLGSQLN